MSKGDVNYILRSTGSSKIDENFLVNERSQREGQYPQLLVRKNLKTFGTHVQLKTLHIAFK